jgi:DNA-nicking Smr family endonuclease
MRVMARRRRSSDDLAGRATPAPLNAPFRQLRQRWNARPAPLPPARRAGAPARPPQEEEPDLFASAMDGVVPLPRGPHGRVARPAPAAVHARPVSEEAETLAALSDLVAGVAHFDITDTREYIEGVVVGLDPRVVRRLRRGDFAWQSHLDLHGLTATEARHAVDRFILEGFRAGWRCVLIVHGRGLNSKDRTPVLKERLKTWLAHGRISKVVLAFSTARPCDGGAGALYVLLRRERRARPIRVTEGAKQ